MKTRKAWMWKHDWEKRISIWRAFSRATGRLLGKVRYDTSESVWWAWKSEENGELLQVGAYCSEAKARKALERRLQDGVFDRNEARQPD